MNAPLIKVECNEPDGTFIRCISLFDFSADGVKTLYDKAKQFPVLFAQEFSNEDEFISMFVYRNQNGGLEVHGTGFIIDNYLGVIYVDQHNPRTQEATLHFSFFDRRFKGRARLLDKFCQYIYEAFDLQRLNVIIPAYVPATVRHFIELVGFTEEGIARSCIPYKGKRFDAYCYGRLKGEMANV